MMMLKRIPRINDAAVDNFIAISRGIDDRNI
jgi:hypothetical protein